MASRKCPMPNTPSIGSMTAEEQSNPLTQYTYLNDAGFENPKHQWNKDS